MSTTPTPISGTIPSANLSTVPPTIPAATTPPASPWKQTFPAKLAGVLGFVQISTVIIIVGCEIGSILIDIITATIYVGLWSSLFFIPAAIALTGSSCCCRERGCARFTLVSQILALFFSLCVIGFDAYFIINTSSCFFTSTVCNGVGSSRGVFYSTSNFNDIKMPLIKGQLGAACLMFVLCLLYIIMYIVTAVRSGQNKSSPIIHPLQESPLPIVPTGPDGMILAPPVTNIRSQRGGSPLYHRPTIVVDQGDGRANDLICPTCTTTMSVTVRKKLP